MFSMKNMEPLAREYTSNAEVIARLVDRVNELTEICNEWRKAPDNGSLVDETPFNPND